MLRPHLWPREPRGWCVSLPTSHEYVGRKPADYRRARRSTEFLQSNVKGDVRRATHTHTERMPSEQQIRVSQQAIALEMAGNGEVQFLQRPEKPASSNDVLDSTSSASPDKSIHKLHGATPGRPSAACCHPPMRTCLSQVRHSSVMS